MYPRRDTNKARRTLVLSALVIFLGEILAGFIIDRAPLEIRFPDVPRIIRLARQRGRAPDIIFFGSSRTQSQINTDAIEEELSQSAANRPPLVFNAGISYGEPVVFDFLAAKLLEAGVRPAVAVVEVSPETVSRRLLALDVHLTRQFTWAEALESLPHTIYARGFARWLSTRLVPVYLFRSELRRWAIDASGLQSPLCCPAVGTNAVETRAPSNFNPASPDALRKQAIIIRNRLRDFQISGIAPRALERMVQRYKNLGVTTILLGVSISSPSRKEYIPAVDSAFLAYMDKLSEGHGAHFVDFRDRVPDQYFRAVYYTTEKGSGYVSRLLARDVLAPLWRSGAAETDGFSPGIGINAAGEAKGKRHSRSGRGTATAAKLEKQ